MAYSDDLLALAQQLANPGAESPQQASLRRAMSTAYYALFHLLISEATLNWGCIGLRPALGRVFEHGNMKSASEIRIAEFNGMLKKNPPPSPELSIAKHLHTVAKAFVQSQQKREHADYYYDPSKDWTPTEVMIQIDSVAEAFRSWREIREEPAAQTYLVSLLGKKCRME